MQMNELKINPRFEKFARKKKQDEIDGMIKSLKEDGYKYEYIFHWNGYIVDGHNRYKLCKQLGITIPSNYIEELPMPADATELDVMKWIMTHELTTKSLEPGEKLAMLEDFKEEVRIENEKKKKEGNVLGAKITNSSGRTPHGVQARERKETWGDAQIAKKAGVGVGTVARYNQVMKSGDESLKEKVKAGEIKIGTAYREIKEKEKKAEPAPTPPAEEGPQKPESYKDVSNSYAGMQGRGGIQIVGPKTTDKEITEEDMVRALKEMKESRKAVDFLDIPGEFDSLVEHIINRIHSCENILFGMYEIQDKITEEEIKYGEKKLLEVNEAINTMILKVKGELKHE